jgi:hypothetical protein
MLEAFVDRELGTDDQVAVEVHLRSCRTCATRVDDLALIGWSLRSGTQAMNADGDASALAVIESGVFARLRAEEAQSWRVRLPDLFSDMRLWWPAVGATAAVVMCLYGAASVWRIVTTQKQPHSMAWLLEALENPGSDRNPMRLDNGMSLPRVPDEGLLPEMASEDAVYAVAVVLTQTGEVGGARMLPARTVIFPRSVAAAQASERQAVLDAVLGSRFTPALDADGRKVAVHVVLLIERTTIREAQAPRADNQWARRTGAKPVLPPSSGTRSSIDRSSPTA